MKTSIVLSVTVAFILLAGSAFAPAFTQPSTPSDTPTFYRLVPGIYVNGYPRFTIKYPKDWVEQYAEPGVLFRAAPPGAPKIATGFRSPSLTVFAAAFKALTPPLDVPVEKDAEFHVSVMKRLVKDVRLLYNKPSPLPDGNPAYEYELEMLVGDQWLRTTSLVTKKGDLTVKLTAENGSAKITNDLKAYLFSLQFDTGQGGPVTVPPDVREFLDRWANDVVSQDLAKVMSHYSDKYRNSGDTKAEVERFFKADISKVTGSSGLAPIADFVRAGDIAYLTLGGLHLKGGGLKPGCGA
jgi:hypothetical protein